MFTRKQLKSHTEAGIKLDLIKDEVKSFIKIGITEKEVLEFIKKRYKAHSLVNDSKKEFAIVAFGKNTREVHYFPKANGSKLKRNSLVLLDMWARLDKPGSPYADMTWMFYYGKKVPKEIENKWKILVRARSAGIHFLQKMNSSRLPRGLEVDRICHDIIGKAGFGESIKHTIGHSLGLKHPHGDLPGINWKEYSPLQKNVPYTIEPGIYFKDFGMRTEIDFYINKKTEVVITTPVQKDIAII